MFTLCQNFAPFFPNVEKTEYFSSTDSIRIYGKAHTATNNNVPYTADIIPSKAFDNKPKENFWDQYDNYKVILQHGDNLRTGSFATGKELEDLLRTLFKRRKADEIQFFGIDTTEYHQKAEQFFYETLSQLWNHTMLNIFSIDYQMRAIYVTLTGFRNMWRLNIGTKQDFVQDAPSTIVLTPYICAWEVNNPVFIHSSQCYAIICARDLNDFIDKFMHPNKPSDLNSLGEPKLAVPKQESKPPVSEHEQTEVKEDAQTNTSVETVVQSVPAPQDNAIQTITVAASTEILKTADVQSEPSEQKQDPQPETVSAPEPAQEQKMQQPVAETVIKPEVVSNTNPRENNEQDAVQTPDTVQTPEVVPGVVDIAR